MRRPEERPDPRPTDEDRVTRERSGNLHEVTVRGHARPLVADGQRPRRGPRPRAVGMGRNPSPRRTQQEWVAPPAHASRRRAARAACIARRRLALQDSPTGLVERRAVPRQDWRARCVTRRWLVGRRACSGIRHRSGIRQHVGRNGDHELDVDRRLSADEVHQRPGPRGLDAFAPPVGDVAARQGVDGRPALGCLLAGERALPPVHPGLLHPASQPARLPRPLRPLPQQVRADPCQRPAAPPPQLHRGLDAEVRDEDTHDGFSNLGRRLDELVGHHARAISVESPIGHGRVEDGQPRPDVPLLQHHYGVTVLPGPRAGHQADRQRHPPLRVLVRDTQRPGHDVRRIERHMTRHPPTLEGRAVLEPLLLDRRQTRDRHVLHRGRRVGDRLARRHQPGPLPPRRRPVAPATRDVPGQHGQRTTHLADLGCRDAALGLERHAGHLPRQTGCPRTCSTSPEVM